MGGRAWEAKRGSTAREGPDAKGYYTRVACVRVWRGGRHARIAGGGNKQHVCGARAGEREVVQGEVGVGAPACRPGNTDSGNSCTRACAQQQEGLRGAGAGCSASWMPPAGCCGAADLGSLQGS